MASYDISSRLFINPEYKYSEIIDSYEVTMNEENYDFWSGLNYFEQQTVINEFRLRAQNANFLVEIAYPDFSSDFEKKLEIINELFKFAKKNPTQIQRFYTKIDNKLFRHEFFFFETYFRRDVFELGFTKDDVEYDFLDIPNTSYDKYDKNIKQIVSGEIIRIPIFDISEIFSLVLSKIKYAVKLRNDYPYLCVLSDYS
jgi:hypothetical protein